MSHPRAGLLVAAALTLWSPAVLACGNGMEGDRIPFLLGGMALAAIGGLLVFCLMVSVIAVLILRRREQAG